MPPRRAVAKAKVIVKDDTEPFIPYLVDANLTADYQHILLPIHLHVGTGRVSKSQKGGNTEESGVISTTIRLLAYILKSEWVLFFYVFHDYEAYFY